MARAALSGCALNAPGDTREIGLYIPIVDARCTCSKSSFARISGIDKQHMAYQPIVPYLLGNDWAGVLVVLSEARRVGRPEPERILMTICARVFALGRTERAQDGFSTMIFEVSALGV
jgi:hypothetical protein